MYSSRLHPYRRSGGFFKPCGCRQPMGNQPAYSDMVVRLEAAVLAIGRLDAVLSDHPLLPAWTFWSQLDTARRHAEAVVGGSISIGSPCSRTACRSGSAPPCHWPSGEVTSPPSPSSCAPGWSNLTPTQDPLDRITGSPWGCRHCLRTDAEISAADRGDEQDKIRSVLRSQMHHLFPRLALAGREG
jgi:hypothetical protein